MTAKILPLSGLMILISTLACAQEPLVYVPPAFASSGSVEFDAWRNAFATKAIVDEKKDPVIVEMTLSNLSPNPDVKRLNESQPEFVRPIWAYIGSAVSQNRINQGQALFAARKDALSNAVSLTGVPAEYAFAIWGIESSFGGDTGKSDVVRALATFAYTGRRTALGESELLAVFDMLQRGEVTRNGLVGSWAGAMGHTQFMPSSFLSRAIDGDGDGKRDIWNNPTDALASTLNYLARAGWKRDEPWGFEVRVPADFDWSLADGTLRPLPVWSALGVVAHNGSASPTAPETMAVRLLAPAGSKGAAFLVGVNYNAIKSYNAADAYALSVALLGDQIATRGIMPSRWPVTDPPLGRSGATELQTLLNALNFSVGTPDGQAGPRTRSALQTFQKSQNLVADGYPSQSALNALRSAAQKAGVIAPPPTQPTTQPPALAPVAAATAPTTGNAPPPPSKVDPNYKGPPPVKMTW